MNANLRIVSGAKPAVIRLKLPTVIGRSGSANLTVKSSRVSRQHCEIDLYDGELTVRDLDSSNGTFVNGHRISEVTFLSPGDQLTIGKLTLQAEYEVGGQTSDAPPAPDTPEETPAETNEGEDISSRVHYKEVSDGSFLGIEDLVRSEANLVPPPDAPASDPSDGVASDINASPASESNAESVDLDIDDPPKRVDPGDSQLNKFFDGLS